MFKLLPESLGSWLMLSSKRRRLHLFNAQDIFKSITEESYSSTNLSLNVKSEHAQAKLIEVRQADGRTWNNKSGTSTKYPEAGR